MEPAPFLTIDDQPVSLAQALGYLRATDELEPFLLKILQQHLLAVELQARQGPEIDPASLERAVIDFRLQHQLTDPERFQAWLNSKGFNDAKFRYQIATELKIKQLQAEVTASQVEAYFTQNQPLLDSVVLWRIVVADIDLAENLKRQIRQDDSYFKTLAGEHSLTGDRVFNGLMGAVRLGQLPPPIREQLANASPGDLIGPVEFEGRYSLLRVEQFLPACLDEQLKHQLQEQLFDQWLQAKVQQLTVEMHVD